jgi:hypothetical protein
MEATGFLPVLYKDPAGLTPSPRIDLPLLYKSGDFSWGAPTWGALTWAHVQHEGEKRGDRV